MSKCTFVRRGRDGWEYGHIEVHDHGTSKEVRKHIVKGHADSMEEALTLNKMALEGQPKIRPHIEPSFRR